VSPERALTSQGLLEALHSERFINACRSTVRAHQVTIAHTQAAMVEMIHILASANVLEIGTYFADTARYLAEAMAELGAGHLTTIDPYGGHRVPGIIESWPIALQQYVTFRAENSMTFFANLEGSRAPIGRDAPFDIAYVDGHHSFDYAFFDLMRSALYLRPGGALVVDNLEQSGPNEAVRLFKQRHTHWQIFKTFEQDDDGQIEFMPGTNGAIILAPNGIEIGADPYKFTLNNLGTSQIQGLRLRVRHGAYGLLKTTTNLYIIPSDHHLTGIGIQSDVGPCATAVQSRGNDDIVITYDPPLQVFPESDNHPVAAQIELSFFTAGAGRNLLLTADNPISVE
jgi:predicted O-methyltransferase YrrM